jgi:hypothetical protein
MVFNAAFFSSEVAEGLLSSDARFSFTSSSAADSTNGPSLLASSEMA